MSATNCCAKANDRGSDPQRRRVDLDIPAFGPRNIGVAELLLADRRAVVCPQGRSRGGYV